MKDRRTEAEKRSPLYNDDYPQRFIQYALKKGRSGGDESFLSE